MPGLLASILRRITGGSTVNTPAARASTDDAPAVTVTANTDGRDQNQLRDRALVAALDRAMDMGLREHARRVARSAMRVYPRSARLTERLARLAMIDNTPERALQLIDGTNPDGPRDTALRLLRAGCLVQLGRRERAHVDLLRWSRRPEAPIEARLMLALLEWDGADPHGATLVLLRNLRRAEDPRSLELLALIAVAQARTAKAREWADRLVTASAFGAGSPYAKLLLCSLQLPPARAAARPTPTQVENLARELLAAEEVVPALVEAQRIRPDTEVAGFLGQALARALPAVVRPGQALEALTRLAMISGDRTAARRWAEQGLAVNPMSAPLSIMYRALAEDEARDDGQTTSTPAADVLATIGSTEHEPDSRGKAA